MFQDHLTLKSRHEKFVQKICETEVVYALENDEGFATSSSNNFEDEEGEPVGIICFWSEKELANSCIDEEWKNYQISEVKISDFLENWCVGMSNDELIVGTNFDRNLFGYEIEPLDLILEVTTELKSQNKNVEFRKFDNIDDLKNQVENSIR